MTREPTTSDSSGGSQGRGTRWPQAGPSLLVWRGRSWPLTIGDAVFGAPTGAQTAPILTAEDRRWVVTDADPRQLSERKLDRFGVLRLPACLHGWRFQRETTSGHPALTTNGLGRLAAAPGEWLEAWIAGLHPADLPALGPLGRVADVAVADRLHLPYALATGPEPPTTVLETPLGDLNLFVYGTLQPGRLRWPLVAELVEMVGSAVARGVMTATPMGYPAASFDASSPAHVHGTLLRPRNSQAALTLYRRTDRIEDAGGLFLRVTVRVDTAQGPGWAAAYAWNPERGEPPGQIVASGRWLGLPEARC